MSSYIFNIDSYRTDKDCFHGFLQVRSQIVHGTRPGLARVIILAAALLASAVPRAAAQPARPAGDPSSDDGDDIGHGDAGAGVRDADGDIARGALDPSAGQTDRTRRDRAQKLFEEANRLRQDALIAQARERYSQALALYDHPYIHYNLALCLRSLDRPVEAYVHLQKALDSDELDTTERAQAELYAVELRKRVTELEIICKEPGARVSVNGRSLFTGPGTTTLFMEPGHHVIVAEKTSRLTTSTHLSLAGDEVRRVELILPTLERHFEPWIPWAVMSAGAALALTGVPWHLSARQSASDFRTEIDQSCATQAGCDGLPASAGSIADRGRTRNILAVGAVAMGSLVVLTGAVLAYWNQPRLVERTHSITPLIGPGSAGVAVRF